MAIVPSSNNKKNGSVGVGVLVGVSVTVGVGVLVTSALTLGVGV